MTETPNTHHIFLTGGASALGRATVRALAAAGHQVTSTAPTSLDANHLRADGALPVYSAPTDSKAIANMLKMAKTDTVIHLAPQAYNSAPFGRHDWDAAALQLHAETEALLEAAAASGVKSFIHTSFASLPDHNDDHLPFFEVAATLEAAVLAINGCVLRVGFLFGESPEDPLHELERLLRRGLPFAVGDSHAHAYWLAAADLPAALVNAVRVQPAAETLALVNDTPLTVAAFAKLFASKIGLSLPGALPAFMIGQGNNGKTQAAILSSHTSVEAAPARERLNWKPRFATTDAALEDILLTWRASAVVTKALATR
ncbi:MAG: NAD-dependent epimerase/dehydratase family protein [Phototrophicaceae bacterium]